MKIYHFHEKVFSRAKGCNTIGASAYRAGEILKNEYDGLIHDFRKKLLSIEIRNFITLNTEIRRQDSITQK